MINDVHKHRLAIFTCDATRYFAEKVVDAINRMNGSETIVLGSQQYTAEGGKGKAGVFRDSIKHDFRSPNYTTRWGEIPEAE